MSHCLSASEWATTIFMQSQSHRKQSKPFFYQCWDWGHKTIFNKNYKTGPKLSTCHFLMLTSYICSWHSGIFVWCPAHHSTPGHTRAQYCSTLLFAGGGTEMQDVEMREREGNVLSYVELVPRVFTFNQRERRDMQRPSVRRLHNSS